MNYIFTLSLSLLLSFLIIPSPFFLWLMTFLLPKLNDLFLLLLLLIWPSLPSFKFLIYFFFPFLFFFLLTFKLAFSYFPHFTFSVSPRFLFFLLLYAAFQLLDRVLFVNPVFIFQAPFASLHPFFIIVFTIQVHFSTVLIILFTIFLPLTTFFSTPIRGTFTSLFLSKFFIFLHFPF